MSTRLCFRLPSNYYHDDVFNDTALHVFNTAAMAEVTASFWQVAPPVYDASDLEYIQR
jgi:hypothetical protein